MNFSFSTFFSSLSCRPHYQLLPQPPSFTTAVGSSAPCSEPNEDVLFCDSCSSIPDLQVRGTQMQKKGKAIILARGEISQIIAPQCPEDTCNHWGRCQSNNAVLHRCSEQRYLVHYYLGNAPSNFTATSLLSSFVGPALLCSCTPPGTQRLWRCLLMDNGINVAKLLVNIERLFCFGAVVDRQYSSRWHLVSSRGGESLPQHISVYSASLFAGKQIPVWLCERHFLTHLNSKHPVATQQP